MQEALVKAVTTVLNQIAGFFPNLLGAGIIFALGLVISNWGKKLTVKFIKAINLNRLLKNTGVEKFLQRAELPKGVEEVLGQVVRWVILLVFFIATMNLLGLGAVAEVLNQILAFVPRVVAATLILAVGIIVAGILEGVVKGAATGLNGQAVRLLAKVTSYSIMVFAVLAAVSELNIAKEFINTLFTGFVAALALALGLALGLGSKQTVEKILKEWYAKSKS